MPLTNHIAIYGGSFDPVHFAHEVAILWLLETLNAKKVLIAPTAAHYFNKQLTPFDHRFNMCKLIVRPFGNKTKVIKDELHLPHPNTTLNLLQYIKLHYPSSPISVVIGPDLLPNLHKWKDWDKVAKESKVIVIGRQGTKIVNTPLNIHQYPIELPSISSTDIKKRIINRHSLAGLISKSVEQYNKRP